MRSNGGVAVVESWWNGVYGLGSRRVRLRHDWDRWTVETEASEMRTTTPCVDERQARAELVHALLAAGASLAEDGTVTGDRWRRVDAEAIQAGTRRLGGQSVKG
jgi:hypothetical protein